MTKEEIRRILNTSNQNFYYVVKSLSTYFLTEPVKSMMLNYIVLKAKEKGKFTTLDLISLFYEFGKDIVTKTVFCNSTYSEKMLMKTVWEEARILNLVILQIKNSFKILDIPEKDIEKLKELEKKERLKRQAELMRAAKKRKRLEKVKSQSNSLADFNTNTGKSQDQPVKKSKFTKEQLERIELLKNIKL